jgi:3-hydroxybutyryl-CoA dehydratase
MQLKIGDKASLSKTISEQDVSDFARLSLDTNPLHLDEDYARQTRFGGRIVHGMLGASLVSAVIGTQLGGPIYLSQSLKFLKPIHIGEKLTATAEVIAIRETKISYTQHGCDRRAGEPVIQGEAPVLPIG